MKNLLRQQYHHPNGFSSKRLCVIYNETTEMPFNMCDSHIVSYFLWLHFHFFSLSHFSLFLLPFRVIQMGLTP